MHRRGVPNWKNRPHHFIYDTNMIDEVARFFCIKKTAYCRSEVSCSAPPNHCWGPTIDGGAERSGGMSRGVGGRRGCGSLRGRRRRLKQSRQMTSALLRARKHRKLRVQRRAIRVGRELPVDLELVGPDSKMRNLHCCNLSKKNWFCQDEK